MAFPATQIITGKTRLAFARLVEPGRANDEAPLKFSCVFLIPKSDEEKINAIRAAIKAAYELGLTKLKGNKKNAPSFEEIKKPLKDGDDKKYAEYEGYAGHYVITASANLDDKPRVVDLNMRDVEPKEIYSGMYARAYLTFYAYNTAGNQGISVGINDVQKICDGPRFDGRKKAEDVFNDGYAPEEKELDFL